jgi:hypothetical protein
MVVRHRGSHIFIENWLTDGDQVASLKRRPPFTARKIVGTRFCQEAELTPGPQCGALHERSEHARPVGYRNITQPLSP